MLCRLLEVLRVQVLVYQVEVEVNGDTVRGGTSSTRSSNGTSIRMLLYTFLASSSFAKKVSVLRASRAQCVQDEVGMICDWLRMDHKFA
jgi:hypothetical protein